MLIDKNFSRWVYEDGLEAASEPGHPCRHMVEWQTQHGFEQFQLPEPFGGAQSELGLAFIGLNPSISQSNSIPKAANESTFEQYDNFYRTRFELIARKSDGQIKENVRLWRSIERFGNKQLSNLVDGHFKLGQHAVLIEAVRYKSTKAYLGDKHEKMRLLEHQRPFTNKLLESSGCKIIAPMGNAAIREVNQLLKFPIPIPNQVGKAMGNLYIGETLNGAKIFVCPISHMSWAVSREDAAEVGKQIMKAYDLSVAD